MFSAMMFALKQIGDHSLQAKKIWHKKRICYLQKKCFFTLYCTFDHISRVFCLHKRKSQVLNQGLFNAQTFEENIS